MISLVLGTAVFMALNLSAASDSTHCPTPLDALPTPQIMQSSLTSCVGVNEETFEDATPESFCRCQESVFSLVRASTPVSVLKSERHYHLGSYAFREGFKVQSQALREVAAFERLYTLEDADKFRCHVKDDITDAIKDCSQKNGLDNFLDRTISEHFPEAKESSSNADNLNRILALQLDSVTADSDVVVRGCLNQRDKISIENMTGEIIIDQVRAQILANKARILQDPEVELSVIFNTALAEQSLNVQHSITSHPLFTLFKREPTLINDFIHWLEANPNAQVAQIFNGEQSNPMSKALRSHYQENCEMGLAKIKSGLKEGVCAENSLQITGSLQSLVPENLDASEISNLMKNEAFIQRYCQQLASPSVSSESVSVIDPSSSMIKREEQTHEMSSNAQEDGQFCQMICARTQSAGEACAQKDVAALKVELEQDQCRGPYACLEVKALVRLREREIERQQVRLARGQTSEAPMGVVGRILVDQGMDTQVVERQEKRHQTKTRPTSDSKEASIATGARPVATPEQGPDNTGDEFINNFAQAMQAPTENAEFQMPATDPSTLSEAHNREFKSASTFKGAKRVLTPAERARDEETKRLRKAIADLEEMSQENRANFGEGLAPQIPYARDESERLGENNDYDTRSERAVERMMARPIPYAFDDERRLVDGPRSNGAGPNSNDEEASYASSSPGALEAQASELTNFRAPASSGAEAAVNEGKVSEGPTSLRFNARDLDQLGPEFVKGQGLDDEDNFVLEVVMEGGQKVVLIPVKKNKTPTGLDIWEPQLTRENKEYFERVLEIPLFRDFKRQLIDTHFNSSES